MRLINSELFTISIDHALKVVSTKIGEAKYPLKERIL